MAQNSGTRRRKISFDEGGGGGHESAGMMRWLLTYADMITLLLALFIMLFAISQVDKTKFAELSIAFQGAVGQTEVKSGGAKIIKSENIKGETTIKPPIRPYLTMPKIKKRIEQSIGNIKGAKISSDERGLKISLFALNSFFDLGKADLKPQLKTILKKIAYEIRNISNPIRVEGHTDNLPINTLEFPSNWELSTRRATNVLRFLIIKGVSSKKISAAGYADTHPQYLNIPGKGNTKNRRVDIIILTGQEAKLEPK